jgi:monoamine oxidase
MINIPYLIDSDDWRQPPGFLKPAKQTTVLILGAGMAGLAAGYELMNHGYDVRIVEARDSPGGRVRTLRDGFSQGVYAEAGATFLPSTHGLTAYYANLMKLNLVAFDGADLPYIYHVKGKRIVYSPGTAIDWPYALTEAEQKMGLDGMQLAYTTPPGLLGGPVSSLIKAEQLTVEDATALPEKMRENGASAGAIELLNAGFNQLLGEGSASYSAAMMLSSGHYLSQNILTNGPDLRKIEGGNDLYPKALAATLGDRISYSTEVMQIAQDANGVRVTCRDKDGQHEASADYVICTLPFSVLRDIPVTPAFSAAKAEAVRALKYTSVMRIFLEIQQQFWRSQGLSGEIVSDQPMTEVYPGYNPANQPGMLGVYMAAGNARSAGALAPDKQIEFALSQIELVYPEVRKNFTAGVSKFWDADPFAKGGYVWFAPAQMTSLLPVVATPEGRIYFAGDHASTLPGWIQGAIASGLRAANDIGGAASQ